MSEQSIVQRTLDYFISLFKRGVEDCNFKGKVYNAWDLFINPENISYFYKQSCDDLELFINSYKGITFEDDDVAIVMTGIPVDEKKYSLNTLLMYRKIYPNVPIFLSTWDGCINAYDRSVLERANIAVVTQADIYENIDKGHLANQVEATRKGISEAKKCDKIKYIFKTRTDIRIDKIDFLRYFKTLISLFKNKDGKQEKRLINISFCNTVALLPFHFSDWCWFGSVTELDKLYDIQYRTDEMFEYLRAVNESTQRYKDYIESYGILRKMFLIDSEQLRKIKLDIKYLTINSEEVFVSVQYAKRYIDYCFEKIDFLPALKKHLNFAKDYLILVDQDELEAHHYKGKERAFEDSKINQVARFSHSQWLELQC